MDNTKYDHYIYDMVKTCQWVVNSHKCMPLCPTCLGMIELLKVCEQIDPNLMASKA